MAAQKPSIPKGTRDFGPSEVHRRRFILGTIETVFKKYGFMPIETPVMENLSTLEGKYGDEGDKLLFRILESGDFWSKTGKELSKFQFYLLTSLREVTWYIFKRKALNETDAKDYHKLHDFLVRNYDVICEQALMINLLYGHEGVKKVRSEIKSKLHIVAIYLVGFYQRAHLYHETEAENIDFHFDQFVVNEFDSLYDLFNKFEVVPDVNDIREEITLKGLRYDLTVPFARFVVMNRNDIAFPFRRYQMQPVWRADRPQKGRYREFWQCDADVVGSDSLLNELDLVQIYDEAFRNLGVAKYELRLNNRKVLAGIAEVVKGKEFLMQVSVAIDKLDKVGREGVAEELRKQAFTENELGKLFDIITLSGDNRSLLESLAKYLEGSTEGLLGIKELTFLLDGIDKIGSKDINLRIDFSLARGLSYYTGCIFEVVCLEGSLTSSIGGGGRYDNLTGSFGMPGLSGVGISFGLDRIYDVMDELGLFPAKLKSSATQVLFCCFDEASQLYALDASAQLRNAGISCEIYPDLKKLGKQLDYANALAIPFAAIAGDTEREQQKFQLKDLVSGDQQLMTVEEMIARVSETKAG